MSHPSIDHSLLSPSGKMSKRARRAALMHEHSRLFPPGFWDQPELTEEQKIAKTVEGLRSSAKRLRELADRGMSVTKFRREADRLDAEANAIESA